MNADVEKAVESMRVNSWVSTSEYLLIDKALRDQDTEIAGNDAENAELVRALDMCRMRAEKAEALLRFLLDRFGTHMDESDEQAITAHLGASHE